MAKLSKIGIAKELAVGVGANSLTSMLESSGSKGYKFIAGAIDRAAIGAEFDKQLLGLKQGQGALYGFVQFKAPDGSVLEHGPFPFGSGSRPAEPLVSLGYSNKAAAGLGLEAVEKLELPPGTQWSGASYYWAMRDAEGINIFHVDDTKALLAEAMAEQFRHRALPILASKGPTLDKLSAQSKLFDGLENKLRDELRSKNIEGQLLGSREKMRRADEIIRRAKADRQTALAEAKQAQGFQNISNLFGLAASFTSFVEVATAKAEYAKTEEKGAVNNYNSHVTNYILILNENTSVSPGSLPETPLLPLP